MTDKPFAQSYWVHPGLLCAGQFPGGKDEAERDVKLNGLLACNLRRIVNLMEPTEKDYDGKRFEPYLPRLWELAAARGLTVEWIGIPTRDARAPAAERMGEILAALDDGLTRGIPTYLHCWGGHGRTGTAVACHLLRRGHTAEAALAEVLRLRAPLPKNHDPFEGDQREFVMKWSTES